MFGVDMSSCSDRCFRNVVKVKQPTQNAVCKFLLVHTKHIGHVVHGAITIVAHQTNNIATHLAESFPQMFLSHTLFLASFEKQTVQ